jgi:trehalose synthase
MALKDKTLPLLRCERTKNLLSPLPRVPALYAKPAYAAAFIEQYDAVVLSLSAYAQELTKPQRFIVPAINPFSTTNRELSDSEINDRLSHHDIPTDLPFVVQVSRFDRWKDPQGVIEAFKIARKQVDCTLVLVGNIATDDPEGQEVFASLCRSADDRIRSLGPGLGAR